MDEDLLGSISKALQKLQKEQTILSNKLIRITEVCKNKFIKVEHEQAEKHANHENKMAKIYDEKFTIFENRLDKLETRRNEEYVTIDAKVETLTNNIEEYKKKELKLSYDVSDIETKRKQVDNKISLIDETLKRVNENLEAFKQSIDDDKPESVDRDIRKTCRFHNKGHCNQKESSPFFHGNTICEIFRETGACWKQVCRERHPKIC